MSQNITLLGASYSAVPAVRLPKTGGGTADFTDVSDTTAAAADVATGKYFYTAAGVRTKGTNSGSPNLQDKTNISPSTSSQTIRADSGYDGLSSVQINAMPTQTLPTSTSSSGTGTTKATVSRSTSDQYINIPTGYNSTAVNYKISAVANGSAGTPTATKGTVSNHAITVTPSVTNTTGYITGSTINGTAVTVSASELDSGSKSITANGNSQDVVGYASVDVNVPNSYSASDEGKVVSSGALVAQTSRSITENGTYDTTNNNEVVVNVSGDNWTTLYTGTTTEEAILRILVSDISVKELEVWIYTPAYSANYVYYAPLMQTEATHYDKSGYLRLIADKGNNTNTPATTFMKFLPCKKDGTGEFLQASVLSTAETNVRYKAQQGLNNMTAGMTITSVAVATYVNTPAGTTVIVRGK